MAENRRYSLRSRSGKGADAGADGDRNDNDNDNEKENEAGGSGMSVSGSSREPAVRSKRKLAAPERNSEKRTRVEFRDAQPNGTEHPSPSGEHGVRLFTAREPTASRPDFVGGVQAGMQANAALENDGAGNEWGSSSNRGGSGHTLNDARDTEFNGTSNANGELGSDSTATGNRDTASVSSATPSSRIRQRFLAIAQSRAAHFAHFSSEEVPQASQQVPSQRSDRNESEAQVEKEDWPGPFATARKLARDLPSAIAKRESELESSNLPTPTESTPLISWKPSRSLDRTWFDRTGRSKPIKSLFDICLAFVCENVEYVESFLGMPDSIIESICHKLCERRKMKPAIVSLLLNHRPSEIHIADCSQISELEFTQILTQCNASGLEVIDLRMCGRCLSDSCLTSTIANSTNSLPLLHCLTLSEAYRLTDKGLTALINSSPSITSLTLKQCSLITENMVVSIAQLFGKKLVSLSLEGCFQLNPLKFVSSFSEFQNVKRLNFSALPEMTDDVVSEILSFCGPNLLELKLSFCSKLTDVSISAIGALCPKIEILDLQDLILVTENSMTTLSLNCKHLKHLCLNSLKLSDECLNQLISSSGGFIQHLSINSVVEASDKTLLALSNHCPFLQYLDISWCRKISNEALGLLADSCKDLQVLKIFGCSQINDTFLMNHSNEKLRIIGLSDQYD